MFVKLKKRLSSTDSLGARAWRAGGWHLFQTLGNNFLRLGSNLIMTRLLLPDAFALLTFVFIVITGLTLMTDLGIRQSIIRDKDGSSEQFLRTAWVLKLCQGFLLGFGVVAVGLALALTADMWAPAGSVYADPRLPGLLLLGALVPILTGTQSANRELAERRLNFKPWALLETSAQAISIVCMVLLAQFSATVWTLMVGSLVAFLIKAVGSHVFLPGSRMRLAFDRAIAVRIWHFGKWLIGSSIFTFLAQNADKLIFGALLNISTMGLLTIAYVWINAGQMVIQRLVGRVVYPILSEIKREREADLERLLRRVQRGIDVLCVGAFTAAVLLGPILIESLYREEYHTAGGFVTLLALGLLCIRFEVLNNLMLTFADSRGMMWSGGVRAAFLILCLAPCYNAFGLTAALVLTGMHALIAVPLVLYRLRNRLSRALLIENALWMVGILVLGAGLATIYSGG